MTILRVNEKVDLCNVTEIAKDLNLDKNIAATTWRWVGYLNHLRLFKNLIMTLTNSTASIIRWSG